jgi:arsenate reductase
MEQSLFWKGMMVLKIFHNPKCSKSRECLSLVEKDGEKAEIIDYLKNPPSIKELKEVLKKLKLRPKDIVRTKEDVFKDLQLNLDNDTDVLAALAAHPILIERPIVVKDERAAIGRPVENVKRLLEID